MSGRTYDIVLFGATGYTGKLTAEYIAANLPTDIKWAIAGRSASKLEAVAAACKQLNADRIQPVVEVCNLNDAELGDLARKTTVLLSTVGPYAQHGEFAFKACAENGTHYFDVTGEVPWTSNMIKKYERAAKATGAILIPQIGVESAPDDLIAWSLVSKIRQELSAPTKEVLCSFHEMRAVPSGGTLATVLYLMEAFSIKEIQAASSSFALSPIAGPTNKGSASLLSRVFGVRTVPSLGTITTSLSGSANAPIVERSWGLLGDAKVYGPKFRFFEYAHSRNVLTGVLTHFALIIGGILLAMKPFRLLMRKYVTQPGDGPSLEDIKNDRLELRAVGYPDLQDSRKTAFCKAIWEGGCYHFTAMMLGEAAITILKDDVVAKKFGGGVLTPATLGQPFIDRIHKAGFKMETTILDN